MKMQRAVLTTLRLTSTLIVLAFLFAIYWVFNNYDWNFPFHKLACFTTLFVTILGFQFVRPWSKAPHYALWSEIGVLVIVLAAIFFIQIRQYHAAALEPPVSDIGYTTIHAVDLVINKHENPYSSTVITVRTDIEPGYRGFHYGPMMMAGYIVSAFYPVPGYKLMSIFYVLVSVILLVFLVIVPGESRLERVANILFVLTAYFLATRFWFEILDEGANDVFHVLLILAALLALKKDRIFWAGLFTGLSFAAKFAPAMFLIPFMPVRQKSFWHGLGLGLTPYIPFLIWDHAGLWRNAFWLRVIIPADWSSLYYFTPIEYQWIYGATMLTAYLIAVLWAVPRKLEYGSVLVGYTLLLIVADITQKQVHGNHLIWFYPLFAILFMDYRERLFGSVSSLVSRFGLHDSPAMRSRSA